MKLTSALGLSLVLLLVLSLIIPEVIIMRGKIVLTNNKIALIFITTITTITTMLTTT